MLEQPSTTGSIQGNSLALQRGQTSPCAWACPAPNCFPGDQRESQGSVGHRRTCHHLPRTLGKGYSPSALSCLALLHETAQAFQPCHQKAKRETVGSCFVLIQHPARHLSQASLVLTQSCPIPPPAKGCWHVPGPCPAHAEPAPGDLHGFKACQEFYPGIWLPFSSKGFATPALVLVL